MSGAPEDPEAPPPPASTFFGEGDYLAYTGADAVKQGALAFLSVLHQHERTFIFYRPSFVCSCLLELEKAGAQVERKRGDLVIVNNKQVCMMPQHRLMETGYGLTADLVWCVACDADFKMKMVMPLMVVDNVQVVSSNPTNARVVSAASFSSS